MRIVQSVNNVDAMLRMYKIVMSSPEVTIRDQRVRNVHNMAVVLDGRTPPITSFPERKLNLNYMKREWLWYLGADPKDDSIVEHAKMWQKLKQEDGTFYSNYGQYLFGPSPAESQFTYVVNALKADRNTRRASMVLLKREHLYHSNTDTVCTYAINFTVNGDALDMTVMMRSNDVVFGFTNDAFCFWSVMEFVYQIMSRHYPGLVRGSYTHFTNSMHVYERHYGMLTKILQSPNGHYYHIDVPRPTPEEVVQILKSNGREGSGAYYEWLTTVD